MGTRSVPSWTHSELPVARQTFYDLRTVVRFSSLLGCVARIGPLLYPPPCGCATVCAAHMPRCAAQFDTQPHNRAATYADATGFSLPRSDELYAAQLTFAVVCPSGAGFDDGRFAGVVGTAFRRFDPSPVILVFQGQAPDGFQCFAKLTGSHVQMVLDGFLCEALYRFRCLLTCLQHIVPRGAKAKVVRENRPVKILERWKSELHDARPDSACAHYRRFVGVSKKAQNIDLSGIGTPRFRGERLVLLA
jgi:hypothetical protein